VTSPLLPLRQQHPELVNQRPDIRSLTASPQMLRAECGKNSVSCASDLKRTLFAPTVRGAGLFRFVLAHGGKNFAVEPTFNQRKFA
jgi:hypothetical protein